MTDPYLVKSWRKSNPMHPRMRKEKAPQVGKRLKLIYNTATEYPKGVPENYVQESFTDHIDGKIKYFQINSTDIHARANDVEGKNDYFPYHNKWCYLIINETKEQQFTDFDEKILRLFYSGIFNGDAYKRTRSKNLFLMSLAIGN